MIYLATPYTHKDPTVMEERYYGAMRLTKHLMLKGYHIFSPIVHCHPIAVQYDLPRDFTFWQEYDKSFIKASEKVLIAYMTGWRESKGMRNDFLLAKELGKTICAVQYVPEMDDTMECMIVYNPWKEVEE